MAENDLPRTPPVLALQLPGEGLQISAWAQRSITSKEVFNSLSADQVAILPFPPLEPFFTSLCRPYIKKQEVIAAIAAEMLVDGMDMDEMCCRRCFNDPEQAAELNFALKLALGKVIVDFAFHTE
ncbi:hypothetical protein PABG_07508 [Paracoccidioides brasiliensis Pb03]|nr:hypothetical protein PABG_07508 [Paracoccidioides brasiliensis Pb03]